MFHLSASVSRLFSVVFISCLLSVPLLGQEQGNSNSSATDGSKQEKANPELEKKIRSFIKQLGSKDYKARSLATGKLKEIGKPAVPYLRKHVDSDNPEVKKRVTNILESIGAWQAVPELVDRRVEQFYNSLKDKVFDRWNPTRSYSYVSTWEWRRKMKKITNKEPRLDDYLHPRIVSGVIDKATPDQKTVLKNLAYLLQKSKRPESVDTLIQLARMEEPEIRGRALSSLQEVGVKDSMKELKSLVISLLSSKNEKLLIEAARLAEKVREAGVVPKLLSLLESEHVFVRFEAFYSLTKVTGEYIYFNAWWKDAKREKIVKEWKSWWEQNKENFEPVPLSDSKKEKSN